jgi:hypothetical protein
MNLAPRAVLGGIMIEPLEIMTGFSQIKSEFRSKCKIEKPLSELALWFTFSDHFLIVHDMEEHNVSMTIATLMSSSENRWQIFFPENSPGHQLIKMAYEKNKLRPEKELNTQYKLTGFIPLRLLK